MIRNLQIDIFQPFGTLLPEGTPGPGRANRLSFPLSEGVTSLYQTTAQTYLNFESGMPILSVSTDGKNFLDFYLDRSICLHRGVYFRLTSFLGNSAVQLSAISMPRLLRTGPSETFSAQPRSRVTALHTLFCHEKEQGFLFPGDAHPVYELTYVDSGSLHSVADGQDLLLRQGDAVIYAPGQWHMQYADIGVAPRFISISFSLENWDATPILGKVLGSNSHCSALLQQMLREQETDAPHTEEILLSLLTTLLIIWEREQLGVRKAPQTLPPFGSENQIIQRAQQYISSHVRDKLTVPAIAQGIDVSASYLTALFQKHLQISPGEYIRRIKLQESKQMIREGKMNLTQIAAELQYSTIHHFSRQFKEKFGITPSEYARSIR